MQTISPRRIFATAGLFGVVVFATLLPAAEIAPSDEMPTTSLTLSPAAEPVPALKYRLEPPLAERTKGNAALAYYRAVIGFEPHRHRSGVAEFPNATLEHWLEMPLEQIPQGDVDKALGGYKSVLEELQRASLCDRCEWEVPVESDGIETLLTEFQDLRFPARTLALCARLQMARGDLKGALDTFRANYQLSRNLGKGPLLITSLIGVAVARSMRVQLETFVQLPTAPNLYWALTELPVPLVDFRHAVEVEAKLPDYSFPEIAQFRAGPVSRDEARRTSERLLKRWQGINDAGATLEERRARFAVAAVASYTADKKTLIAAGRTKEEVEAMPVEQVVWLASYERWQLCAQELIKWTFLPAAQQKSGYEHSERQVALLAGDHWDSPFEFLNLLPAFGSGVEAMNRSDREVALLRTVEALRLYAHAHQGNLPESLEKIDVVPIPDDPVTGRHFVYRLNDGTAVLETAPAFDSKWSGRRYVVRMRK